LERGQSYGRDLAGNLFFDHLSHYHCHHSHPSTVPSDLNEGFGREKLNDDRPFPDRLIHSILAKEGEGIT
jgi:hypothetical protein